MNKIKSFFKSVLKFFSKNTPALAAAAIIAEKATGNEELVKTTEQVAKAVKAGADILDSVE